MLETLFVYIPVVASATSTDFYSQVPFDMSISDHVDQVVQITNMVAGN